jgi:hypothetical protein
MAGVDDDATGGVSTTEAGADGEAAAGDDAGDVPLELVAPAAPPVSGDFPRVRNKAPPMIPPMSATPPSTKGSMLRLRGTVPAPV